MAKDKIAKIFLVILRIVYMILLILIICIWLFSMILSKWGKPRYEANGIFHANTMVDRKMNIVLLLPDNALVDEQYIYGICVYPTSYGKDGFIKIAYVNDLYYLYDANDKQIKGLQQVYGDRVIVLQRLEPGDEQIYLRLKEGKAGKLVETPVDIESWGKAMWDEFRF